MSIDATAQHPEISPAEAAALVEMARSACQQGTTADRVREVRELIEFRIATCNRYLKRLSEWAERGLLTEVASVDQAYPELCKVAHRLSMPDLRLTWDAACEGAGIEVNAQVDERAFMAVSDAVGDANSLEEAVQRFQIAVMTRRSLGTRMRCLRDLLAAAPRNESLRKLTKRYEAEALASLESSCRAAATRGEMKPLRDALEAIDGLGWRGQISDGFCQWLERELARESRQTARSAFGALADRIEAAYAARDLALLGSLSEEADLLEREQQVAPGDEFRARTRKAMELADSEMARLRQESLHADACERLRKHLDAGATAAMAESICSEISATGLPVPALLAERCQRLRAEEARSAQRKKMAIIAAALCALIGLIAVIVFLSR